MNGFAWQNWRADWWWFALALLLLLGVDLATTYTAAGMYGLEFEANPVMRSLLAHGLSVTLAVHLAIMITVVVGFVAILRIGRSLDRDSRRRYHLWCRTWLAVLVVGGLAVSANNLVVIAAGL